MTAVRLSLLVVLLAIAGCSSLIAERQLREEQLTRYLQQPEQLILYYPRSLQLDEQLKVLGMESIAEPLANRFHPTRETRGLIEQFAAAVPALADGTGRIIDPDQWGTLTAAPDSPVLFIHATWQMSYQRLPPHFRKQRLQTGVIAKVIPLGQVLSHKGTIAAHTAVWESQCYFEALEGNYLLIDEWLANDAMRLREAISTTQRTCGDKLATEFARAAGVLSR